MERNLTSGSVLQKIISFSLPYLLAYFLQTLYGMADLYITGQFCKTDLITAVSIGSQVMHMVTVMIVGLAMGTTVMVGRSIGAGERIRAAKSIGNTVTLFLVLSVLLAAVLYVSAEGIVTIISTPKAAVHGTLSYLKICFLGIPFITAYNIISSIFRGLGDSKSPMYFVAIACVCNIVLDYYFIGALGLGASGAALATTISQLASVIISFIFIRRKNTGITLNRSCFLPKKEILKPILQVGIPVSIQDGFIQVSFMLITVIANQRGLNDAAAVGIVEKIISFVFLVPSTMLSTVSALAAQNIGAQKYGRANKTLYYAIRMCIGYGLIIAIATQFVAEPLVALFDSSEAVVCAGGQYIRGYIWDCLFAGIHFSFSGYFCAHGKSSISFIHNAASIVFVRIPGAYFMSKFFSDTLLPMGCAAAAGSALSVIICVIFFIQMQKKINQDRQKYPLR